MKKRKHLVESAEFSFGEGKSLIVCLSSDIGLDRIVIENKNGVVYVRAKGHSRFEFDDKKHGPDICDFLLANPSINTTLKDYLDGRFWGQFNWDDVSRYQENTKLKKALKAEIQKLADEFENKAAKRLNSILKKQKKKRQ